MRAPVPLRPSTWVTLLGLGAVGVTSLLVAYLVRVDFRPAGAIPADVLGWLPLVFLVRAAAFAAPGVPRWSWRSVTLPDVVRIVRAVSLGSAALAAFLLAAWLRRVPSAAARCPQEASVSGSSASCAVTRVALDRKSTRLNSSHVALSRMPSSA